MKNPFDNPVFWLDARARVREKRLWILAAFFLAVPLAISMLLMFTVVELDGQPFGDTGNIVSGVAVFAHGALLVLLSALGAAQRISQERERRTLAALVNSPIEAARIADGKLLGAWRFAAWLSFLTLPFLAAAWLWGGLSPLELGAAWLLNVAASLAAAALALGLSGLFGRSLSAYLATGAVLFLWCAVVPVVVGIAIGSMGPDGAVARQIAASLGFYHLPLAPQVWIYSSGFGNETGAWVVFPVALAVWTGIAAAGRALAIRGLRREVY